MAVQEVPADTPQAREVEDDGEWETLSGEVPTYLWEPAVNDVITGTFHRVNVYLDAEEQVVSDPALADPANSFSYAVIDGGTTPAPRINLGYQLARLVEGVAEGTRVRITYLGGQDMEPGKNPMKMYRVQVPRTSAATA